MISLSDDKEAETISVFNSRYQDDFLNIDDT